MTFKEESLNPKLLKNTFSISAANPKFSGNIKILVDDTLCYLESIGANEDMEDSKLKGYRIDTDKPFRSNLKRFCDLVDNKSAIYGLPDQDFEVVEKFTSQPSTLYRYGAYSDTDKRVDSTHRFFAPLFLGDDGVPDGFAIFKVSRNNNPVLNSNIQRSGINILTNENTEMVKYYDLTRETRIGKFLDDHYQEITEQEVGISVNYTDTVSVIGMDINSGVITESDVYINGDLLSERTIEESEVFLTKSYEVANMIDPRFLNLEFTFSLDNTKIENNDTFVEFVGIYVKNNEILDTELDPLNDINIALTTEYVQTDIPIVLTEPLYKATGMIKGASVGVSKPPMAIIKFNTIPNINQAFTFEFDGNIEASVLMTPELQGDTVTKTIDLLIKEMTAQLQTTSTNLVLNFRRFGSDELHVITTISSVVLETVTITSVPFACAVLEPFIGSFTGAIPNLFGTNKKTLTLASKNITTDIDAVRFSDGSVAVPLLGFRHVSTFAYRMDIDVTDKPLLDIKLLVEKPIVYYAVQNIEHRKFDYNRDISYHSDPLDFDLNTYRSYLLNKIADPTFFGRLDFSATPQELADYKAELLVIVNSFFNNIDIPSTEMLVDTINKNNFAFTTTDSEYKPLQEFNDISLLQNSMYEWVSKLSIRDGFDVTNSPQKFNTSMTFRYDSFTPSLTIPNRDVGQFSHSWYLIGSGTPPWYGTDVIDGYTLNAISEAIILDTGVDVYKNDIHEWSVIKKDPKSKVTSVFFRGIRLIFPDEFDGYRFSVVLISDNAPSGADIEFKLLENKPFKTLTFVIQQFIPEPILTGLEEVGEYHLDRSVLYYSSGGNTTEVSLASLGEEAISLLLFDNTTPKSYNGASVGTDWVYNDNGTDVAYIKLNPAVNNFNLTTMLGLGDDFLIFHGDINPSSTLTFGIQIEFKNIVEIGSDYFWCTGIEVILKELTVPVVFDIVPDYVADNTILFNDNKYATAESIARYNAFFDRTISNNLSVDRYELISLSNIANTVNAKTTHLVDDDTNERSVNMSMAFKEEISLNQSMSYDFTNFGVGRESSVHRFLAIRPSFYYDPITSVIIPSQTTRIEIKHDDIVWFRKASVSLKLPLFDNNSRNGQAIPILEKNISDLDLDLYYSYSLNKTDIEPVRWMYTPSEIRGFLSKSINVTETLSVGTTFVDGQFDLLDVLFVYARKILDNQGIINFLFDPNEYVTALRVYDVNTDNITDEEVRDVITNALIRNVLIDVMRVSNVIVDGVEHDTTKITDTVVKILSLDNISTGNCTVNFIHQ